MNINKTIKLSLLLLIVFVLSCQKDENLPPLSPDAGASFLNIENEGYFVTLGAQEAPEGQTGTWRIYLGDEGRFDDINNPQTKFYGEPGEKYVLGWELSRGGEYKSSSIDVSFKAMEPIVKTTVQDTIFNNRSLHLKAEKALYGATGTWEIIEGEGAYIENADSNLASFIGEVNKPYTVRWTLTYGTKQEYREFSFVTDTLQAQAGPDQLDIITQDGNYFFNLEAFLPAGSTAKWEIVNGDKGTVHVIDNANSLFEGEPDIQYSLKWTVQLEDEISVDTVDVRFRGKWGVWTDERDKQNYKFATINGLEWMAENYNYAYNAGVGSLYYGFSDRSVILSGHKVETPEDRKYYGRLYSFEAAMWSAPEGWRLPTVEEWEDMLIALGGPLFADPKIKEGGSTGLDLNYGGYFQRNSPLDPSLRNVFDAQDNYGYFWTSSVSDVGLVTAYSVLSTSDLPGTVVVNQNYSFAVRYVRNISN